MAQPAVSETTTRAALLLRLLAGAVALVAGLLLGKALLPAGKIGDLPPRTAFVNAFREAARSHAVTLTTGAPRVRLLTPDDENRAVRRFLGDRADEWIARHGRGLEVEVSQAAQVGTAQGQLLMSFSATREPYAVRWLPGSVLATVSPQAPQPERLCELLLRRGETLGKRSEVTGGRMEVGTLMPIVGAAEREHVYEVDPSGATVECGRRPGTLDAATVDLDVRRFATWLLGVLPSLALVVLSVLLFAVLALRGRVDLWNGALLAGLFLVTSALGNWPTTLPAIFAHVLIVPAATTWLLLLWSAAESWARSHLPDFTTTLDTLRRGRLGARAGRELLGGWSAGAALAGLRVALLAGAAVAPGIQPAGTASALPLFGLDPVEGPLP